MAGQIYKGSTPPYVADTGTHPTKIALVGCGRTASDGYELEGRTLVRLTIQITIDVPLAMDTIYGQKRILELALSYQLPAINFFLVRPTVFSITTRLICTIVSKLTHLTLDKLHEECTIVYNNGQ